MSSLGKLFVELIDFTAKVEAMGKEWEAVKTKFDALVHGREPDTSGRKSVLTVFDAQTVIEDFRVGALKDRVLKIIMEVKAEFFQMLHPLGDLPDQLSRDPEVKGLARLFVKAEEVGLSILQFMDRVIAIEKSAGKIIDLLDIIESEKTRIAEKALTHSNKQVRLPDGQRHRERSNGTQIPKEASGAESSGPGTPEADPEKGPGDAGAVDAGRFSFKE